LIAIEKNNCDILYQGFRSTLNGLVVQGYECLLRKQKVVGSNPTQSIVPSVRSLTRGKGSSEYTTKYLSSVDGSNDTDTNLRDLYNRGKRLEYMINRVNSELNEPDKSDPLNIQGR
jgi:hypothetical protein